MNSNKKYFENLDGLRFLAFFSVFISHCFVFLGYKNASHIGDRIISHFFIHGDLGVNFFFVLSGFLITHLLLNEKKKNKTISIRKFFMRRLLRIWPVYFLTLLIGFFVLPALFQNVSKDYLPFEVNVPLSKLVWYSLFVVNFDMVLNGVNYLTVVVLWSISIEEQYYLIWPLIAKFASKYLLVVVLCMLFLLSFWYRYTNYLDISKISYSTFSVINNLAVGGLCSWGIFYSRKFTNVFVNLNKPVIILVYFFFALSIPLRGFTYYFNDNLDRLLVSTAPFVFSLFFAFIILEQNFSRHSFYKMHNIKLFSDLGAISYGLYCYHMISIFIVEFMFKSFFNSDQSNNLAIFIFKALISLTLTILAGWFSYQYYEAKLLKLKNKFSSY